jgi:transposase
VVFGRRRRWGADAVRGPFFDCFAGRGAAADLLLAGKRYQVGVLVGDRATKARVRDALAVARSFEPR